MRRISDVESIAWVICAYFWSHWVVGAEAPTALWFALIFGVGWEVARRTSRTRRNERLEIAPRGALPA